MSDAIARTPSEDGAGPDRAERWETVLSLLADRRRLTVSGTAEELGISESTVRRDFEKLARRQLAVRTHGGVIATDVAYDLPQRYRSAGSAQDGRQSIAARAAELVRPGTVVGFNGGTTTTLVARTLGQRADLVSRTTEPSFTVVSSALNIATEMVLRPHVRTVSLGGVVRAQSYELTGPLAMSLARQVWLDLLIIGVIGVDTAAGATCDDESEAATTNVLVEQSRRTVVVGTAAKLGARGFATICPLSAISTVITESGADPSRVAELRSAGVEVDLV